MTARVAAVGGVSIDTTRDPQGTLHAELFGGNAAYAAWGASLWLRPGGSYLVASVGEDFPASWLAAVAGPGVDVSSVATVPGLATARWRMVYQDGDTRGDLPSEELTVGSNDLRAPELGELDPRLSGTEPFLTAVDTVHCCPVEPSVLMNNLAVLKKFDHTVVIDPGEESADWSPDELAEVLASADVFCPSLLDLDPEARRDPVQAAESLGRRGPSTVIVKLGTDGSLVRTGGRTVHVPAVAVNAIDPTGAGDSYCGAFAAALSRFGEPVVAAILAAATASFAVQSRGLLDSLATATSDVHDRAYRLAERAGISLPALDSLS
ncbi:MAG: pfkB carbohydrate kinase family protein [Pseudonocardiales bacterium]|nr:pfkB carbohydrate kinase family protein [Pseudonocardiales bacterium]